MPSDKPLQRLADIADNISRILDYTQGLNQKTFEADPKTQDAVERCLLRISEAAIKLGPWAEEHLPAHDWRGVRGIGNVLRHAYDGVDPAIIWEVVANDLPPLLEDIERISDPPPQNR